MNKYLFLLIALFASQQVWANDAELEDLYDKYESREVRRQELKVKMEQGRIKGDDPKVSELSTLVPFEDLAVIQRKFLPKTERFELSASGIFSLNNAFFSNFGGAFRAGYYFSEKWGFELRYDVVSSSEKDVTDSLKNRSVKTSSLVTPKSYVGGSVKWSPIYGKMALLQETIVPFDTYFSLGAGQVSTEGDSAIAYQIGAGQTFAISKSLAFRWDLSVNAYSVDVVINETTNAKSTQNQNDLFLGLGVSFYFPEAKYR